MSMMQSSITKSMFKPLYDTAKTPFSPHAGVLRKHWSYSTEILKYRHGLGQFSHKIRCLRHGLPNIVKVMYKGKLPIKPSKKSVKTFLSKIGEVVKMNQQAKTGNLITNLNPITRGWTNYHRHVCAKRTFASVDNAILKLLWQWAKRRHPRRPTVC